MGGSLHMLGAGNGLKGQFVVIKIDHIDDAALKKKLAESNQSAAIAPLVNMAANDAPPEVLNIGLSLAAKQLESYGVYSSMKVVATPPSPSDNKSSLLFPGMAIGAGTVALVAGIGWTAWVTLFRKFFT
jgi:hypothetical protein